MTTEPQIDAAKAFPTVLVGNRWRGGVKIVVQGAMRTSKKEVHGKLQIGMEASWRADVYFAKGGRKADFVLVAKTPPQLFRDLAGLSEAAALLEETPNA